MNGEGSQPKAAKRNRSGADIKITKKRKLDADLLKLVDINNDCLESIFELLDIGDLINVAEADDRFIQAAQSVFSRCHRKKSVTSYNDSMSHIYNDYINVEIDSIAACLCHFGHLISSLSIDFNFEHRTDIERAIQKYCKEPLTTLNLKFCHERQFETLNKPFVNVQNLRIDYSAINSDLSQLSRWFPNLASLELYYVQLPRSEFVEVHFSHLERLTIYSSLPLYETLSKMIHLNPQLKSLALYCYYSQQLMESISTQLVELQELALWTPMDGFRRFDGQSFQFTSVTKFTLYGYRPTSPIHCVPFEFSQLQELNLIDFNVYHPHILKFVDDHSSANILRLVSSIHWTDDLTYGDLERIIRQMPNLIEIEFSAIFFNELQLLQLLSEAESLKNAHLLFEEPPEWWNSKWDAVDAKWNNVLENHGGFDHTRVRLSRKL